MNFIKSLNTQFSKHDQAIALCHNDDSITYGEFSDLCLRYSSGLKGHGITPGDIIGIASSRSIDTFALLLACIDCGVVYVPLDPNFLSHNIEKICEDCTPKYIVCDDGANININAPVISIKSLCFSNKKGKKNLLKTPDFNRIICILYTSGSTNQPKGTEKTYKNICFYLKWIFQVKNKRLIRTQTSSLNFLLSISEIFGVLSSGGKLIVVDDHEKNIPERLLKTVKKHSVSGMWFAPYRLKKFLNYIRSTGDIPPTLKYIICTGSMLSHRAVKNCNLLLPDVTLINSYGCTETGTIGNTYYSSNESKLMMLEDGVEVVVLDENNNVLPYETLGCIAVRSKGVSRYISRNPENRNIRIKGKWYWNVGDFGILHDAKTLTLLGRNKYDIKVKGYRITIEDINEKLNKHPAIQECHLMYVKNKISTKIPLVLFSTLLYPIAKDKLLFELTLMIPREVILNDIFILKELPYLSNDKINKKLLSSFLSSIEDPNEKIS